MKIILIILQDDLSTMGTMMKIILIILSVPFFVMGFVYDFICQGFVDGQKVHKNLQAYFKSI